MFESRDGNRKEVLLALQRTMPQSRQVELLASSWEGHFEILIYCSVVSKQCKAGRICKCSGDAQHGMECVGFKRCFESISRSRERWRLERTCARIRSGVSRNEGYTKHWL